MNTQLVESIIQVVQALPKAEQPLLIERLNRLLPQVESSEPSPAATTEEEDIDPEAWEVWQTLGDDAVEGKLENPSINHDRYLYTRSFTDCTSYVVMKQHRITEVFTFDHHFSQMGFIPCPN
ncbi:hypothetical protein [Trichothermofontia sp.]